MKGISHFAIGVALASCFPAAVESGASGNPLYFILGGVAGLLPDTLDFKFYRFFVRPHVTLTPDPLAPNYQEVADALAATLARAVETGKTIRVKLNTIQLGPDLWQGYTVTFDVAQQRILVQPDGSNQVYSADHPCTIKLDYEATTHLDFLDGPMFDMVPLDGRRVTPRFIPWHRTWSHSLVSALLLGLGGGACLGPLAGGVIFSGATAHILADQLGFMGSSLLFPFSRERTLGTQIIHSGDPLPNLLAVWSSCLVIFWNLYQQAGITIPHFNPLKLVWIGLGMPLGAWKLWQFGREKWLNRRDITRKTSYSP